MFTTNSKTLQKIRKLIPTLDHLEIEFVKVDDSELLIRAPFAPSINHHKTAFAGSIYSVATISGLLMIHEITQLDFDELAVVIGKGEITYFQPITSTYETKAKKPLENVCKSFLLELKEAKKAKLKVKIEILQNNEIVGEMVGIYFAQGLV